MNCKDFRNWLEESAVKAVGESPAASAHYESCQSCRQIADEEQVWRRLFRLIPEHSQERSLWSGIALAIQQRQRLGLSLSEALLLFSRRLAPAFVVFLVITGGWFMWNSPLVEAEGGPMIAMLETGPGEFIEEPDAILISWAEARGQ